VKSGSDYTHPARIECRTVPEIVPLIAAAQRTAFAQPSDSRFKQPIPPLRGANESRECAPDDRLRDEAIQTFLAA
jgi:hypothetical protein